MVLLIARLGLRAPEVIAIQIDDIDWRAGEIVVCGKGSQSCENFRYQVRSAYEASAACSIAMVLPEPG